MQVQVTSIIKTDNKSQSALDLAKSYRGRRVELRREYESSSDQEHKVFLEKALQKHTKLLIQDNRPLNSYLWKAEKNGHSVFLFGDVHKTLQKVKDFEDLDMQNEDDILLLFKTFIHPEVWQAFESSQQFYVELFNFKHASWGAELQSKMMNKYPKAFADRHPFGTLYLEQFMKQQAILGNGLVEYLLILKAGPNTPFLEMGEKLAHFVKEMDDLNTQEQALDNALKLAEEEKTTPGLERLFEDIDALQMGDLNSLALLYEENPSELKSELEGRNINYTSCILNALETGEKAFFAPGASHYIGENGILNLLEKQNVTITRVELT